MISDENLENILKECDVHLYDTELTSENNKKIFRIYITSKEGFTLDKCTEVTKILSPIFDVEPPVSGQYNLEISSPGIERNLKKPKHFKASIGELVKVKLINKDRIEGELVIATDEEIAILDSDKKQIRIKYEDIDKARTYFEW